MAHVVKIYALLLGSALLMFGGGLQGLLLSVRGAEEGFSLFALGLIGTGWSAGFVAGSITVPHLVRRVGHIRSYAVMAVMGGMTILLNLLWINDIGWIVMRAFSGFCFAGAAMIVESWLNEVSENKTRGTIFSTYVTINMAASTLGQLAMSITGTAGFLPFVLGALAFMGAILPTALSSSPQPQPLSSTNLDLGLLYKTSPVAAVAAFSVGMANGTFGTLAPVYGFRLGLSAAAIAIIMSVSAIAGAIAQIPLGRLSDAMDRRLILIGTSLFSAIVGIAFVLLNPGDGWLLYVLFGLYGLAAYPIYAIAVAHANDFAADGQFAKIASGMLLILGVGLAIGPIVASLVMNLMGSVGLFVVTASFHGALAAIAYLRMRLRQALPAESRAPFQAVPLGRHSTPETVALDPRAEDTPPKAPEPEDGTDPADTAEGEVRP
jgi:MFS family permease